MLITDWERTRRREAVAAERQRSEENLELQRRAQQAELAALEERSRIAREIHDGIAQSIYMLSLNLETSADLAQQQGQGLEKRLKGLVDLSKETLLEVRHYIFDLKPYLAGEKGLASMVENQVREFKTVSGVPTTLETRGEERPVPVPVATCVYRVTQEALANAFKHSQATSVRVLLEFAADGVKLMMEDNGQGFDARKPTAGQGLHNMPQRAEELGGTFSLNSSPGKGTRIAMALPC
jgi:two-component system sensor histidine kinase DegS